MTSQTNGLHAYFSKQMNLPLQCTNTSSPPGQRVLLRDEANFLNDVRNYTKRRTNSWGIEISSSKCEGKINMIVQFISPGWIQVGHLEQTRIPEKWKLRSITTILRIGRGPKRGKDYSLWLSSSMMRCTNTTSHFSTTARGEMTSCVGTSSSLN